MAKKRIVMAIGHKDMGTNLPEQKEAVQRTAKVIADFIQEGWQVAIVHSNAPQVGMIHTAMNEFGRQHDGYSSAPMSVCSAMSQGYIGYDLQNGIRAELIRRGIYKPVSTVLTQVTVDPYDEAFYTPVKVIGRVEGGGRRLPPYRGISPSCSHCRDRRHQGSFRCRPDRHCLRRRRYSRYGTGIQSPGCQRDH